MILEILIALIVVLVIANFIVAFYRKRDRQNHKVWKNKEVLGEIEVVEPTIIRKDENTEISVPTKKDFLDYGKVIANEQKLNVLNNRLGNLENVVMGIAERSVQEIEDKNNEIDFEKIDFRMKVLEQQIDEIKNPRARPRTFYGKKHDPMEETIKSLVFNSKRK